MFVARMSVATRRKKANLVLVCQFANTDNFQPAKLVSLEELQCQQDFNCEHPMRSV